MAKNTVTRTHLCEAVYQKVGLSRTECAAFVELVLKEITDCIERGETVKGARKCWVASVRNWPFSELADR
jgi:hypothetical protein